MSLLTAITFISKEKKINYSFYLKVRASVGKSEQESKLSEIDLKIEEGGTDEDLASQTTPPSALGI